MAAPTELPPGFTGDQEAQQKQAQMNEQLSMMMDQILTPEAKDRLARVELTRKEQVQKLKLEIIEMARSGQLREKITEEKLISMLEEKQAAAAPKVSIQRRNYKGIDSDDEDDNDDDIMWLVVRQTLSSQSSILLLK